MIFIDTSAFISRFHLKDRYHNEATKFFERIKQDKTKIFTSDYIIDETITTIFARTKSFEISKMFGEAIISSKAVEIIWVSEDDFEEGWNIFKKEGSMGLSFTDSVSSAIMRRLNINKIFTFDSHFRLMGFEMVP